MQDHASRLQSISDGTHTATYSYLPNSSLLQQTVLKQGTQTRLTTTRQYDNLNRLTQIASTPSGASVVSHAYEFNDANQRTKVTLADGSYWEYGYDLKGQVISAVKKFANGTAIPGMTYQYEFDDIG
ncbi:MAG: hypothetical protein SFY92_03860, partial [Verrucomicrobiae bacterium]|nr:hypothetical protein [Verrucomicrobiae bacterium]